MVLNSEAPLSPQARLANWRPSILIPITSAWPVRNVILSGLADEMSRFANIVFAVPRGRDLGPAMRGRTQVELPEVERLDYEHGHIKQRLGRAHVWASSQNVGARRVDLLKWQQPFLERVKIDLNYRLRGRWESTGVRYNRLLEGEASRWWDLNRETLPVAGKLLACFSSVFFPCPHSSEERWLARCAQSLGCKTMAMIHSFDNPTCTAPHAIQYLRYFCWNQRMKEEIERIYPRVIPRDQIQAVGTPHFRFYSMPEYRGSRAELCRRFDLDASRPVVLYAGGPEALVPHEAVLVARFIEDLNRMPENVRPQLVVRPHPIERNFERWDVLRKNPNVKWSIPWASSPQEAHWAIPTTDSIKEFSMLVRYSDVVINSCSTMSIDAACCDTPVVCLNYTLPPFNGFTSIVNGYYHWDHYVPVVASGGIRLANNPDELVSLVQRYLADPALDRAERAKLVDDMCGPDPDQAVERIAGRVESCVYADVRRS